MPAVRRWRILAFSIIFTLLVISYIDPSHKIRNYCFLCQHPSTSVTIPKDRKINWSEIPVRHPVTSYIPLPVGQAKKIPKVQAPAPQETTEQNEERIRRRELVRESFNHSWNGYKQNAWLHDEVGPLSGKGIDPFGGWAATLVDSLDSLWIMGMKDEFEDAVLVATSIDFSSSRDGQINVFETTIRYLGGFLAAYDISGRKYESLLTKATEIGDLLIRSFDTPNRMPVVRWNWELYIEGTPQVASKRTLLSELGSLSLEFTRLSQLTGEAKFYDAIQRISNELEKSQSKTKLPGMWPVTIDASIPSFDTYNFITLGGMSDSLYEYLPKQYLLLGGLLSQPRTLYEDFITVAKKHLFTRFYNEQNKNLTISGDVHVTGTEIRQEPRGQHLTCFTGGMVALASKIFSRPDELALAEELTQGCIWTYDVSPNGIGPEIFTVMPCPQDGSPCTWDDNLQQTSSNKKSPTPDSPSKASYGQEILKSGLPKGFTAVQDHRYLLRPEAIESVFILYRITGNQMYADAAWRMFKAVELASRTPIAAAGIQNVMVKLDFKNPEINVQRLDSMESFWLAETLKYFFLCFEEWDVVSLDDWVLNTEAHPLKRPKP
ncbi:Mannosyl-oligosaccharide 1,2-alpha-mannosidase MNS1 [Erysiphe neolycopersici]|uniref:alpha-1,2-Mannosidase n=1 Tax=Erysiphe neolycopersici TaxID=212602 RepID=A0A420HPA7_9PEZI|nr:Mannosyl-oligosaccharide 1,2-alpha-mannosidase MNS1 [Erysiphe neolycopersici]